MKTLFCSFALILSFYQTLFSQTLEKELPLDKWRICPIFPRENNPTLRRIPSVQFDGDYNAAKAVISPNETAFFIATSKNDYGVSMISNGLDVKWKIDIKGIPLALLNLKGKVLAITTEYRGYLKPISDKFLGTLIDPQNGQIIKEASLVADENSSFNRHDFQIDKKTGLLNMFLLKTERTNSLDPVIASMSESFKIDEASITCFDESLKAVSTNKINANNSLLLNQCNDGDFVSILRAGDEIMVNKIDGKTFEIKDKQKITLPDGKRKSAVYFKVQPSDATPDVVYVYAEFKNADKDNTSIISKVDFSQKKVYTTTSTFDKEAFNTIKESYTSSNADAPKPSKNYWDMSFSGMTEYKDMLIVLMEEKSTVIANPQYTGTSASAAVLRDALVLVYDKTLKKITSSFFFPKSLGVRDMVPFNSIMKVKDDQLHIITANNASRKENGALVINIDLKTSKVLSQTQIGQQTKNDGFFNPEATIFTGDGLIFNYFVPLHGIMGADHISMWSEKYKF